MNAWMNSTGHRNNILSPSYREIGVGFYFDSGDTGNIRQDQNGDCIADLFNTGPFNEYWTQNFGSRNNVFPMIINADAYETDDINVDLFIHGQGTMVDMRLRNDGDIFSAWMPFDESPVWQLSPVDGLRTVDVEMRNVGMQVFSASDSILLSGFFSCVMPGNFPLWPSVDIRSYVSCIGP